MTEPALVSIVLPTYNGERYIAESIESCLAQTYRRWELVVVDDASTDSTPVIVEGFARRDSRIRLVRHETNKKLPAALNTGFAEVQGEYLTWTSDDNQYGRTALEEMAEVLADRPTVDIVYADFVLIDEDGAGGQLSERGRAESLIECDTIGACFLYRRSVQERLGGYDVSYFLCEDYEFWLRAYLEGFRYLYLARKLYKYRNHPGALTARRTEEIHRMSARAQAAQIGRWQRRAREESVAEALRLSSLAERLGARAEERYWLWNAVAAAPGWLKSGEFRRRVLRALFGGRSSGAATLNGEPRA